MQKRIAYLGQGDINTHPQTYYTVLVERVPPPLRSAPALTAFFEKLFPGSQVHSFFSVQLLVVVALSPFFNNAAHRLAWFVFVSIHARAFLPFVLRTSVRG